MAGPGTPSEIAREVLRLFATRRLAPTPDNFRTLYHEVAGTEVPAKPIPTKLLRAIAERLPRDTGERQRLAKQFEQAIATEPADQAAIDDTLFAWLDTFGQDEPPAWNTLIGNLLRQWEARQLGWTTARKRESLDRVLTANDPTTLHGRLQGLVKAWSQAPSDPEAPPSAEATAHGLDHAAISDIGGSSGTPSSPSFTTTPATAINSPRQAAQTPAVRIVAPGESEDIIANLRELLLLTLDTVVPAFLAEHRDLIREAESLAESVKAATETNQLQTLGKQLRKYAYRLELIAGEDAEIRAGLLKLLRLLLENIDEIVIDDRWLQGQIEVLRDIVDKPANVRLIDDAERRLKEVIFKQSQLKHNLEQAQRNLRALLAGFVDQLASFTESTSSYHDKIATNAARIVKANSIDEIGDLLDEVMRDTRVIQEEARRSRDDLQVARGRAEAAEQKIAQLQHELEETSRLMRHDQLTGALNRRGLEEVFEKESARALRHQVGLCIALLDIDNFKRLNDTYGHDAGDDALIHLTRIIRENLRPNDTVARIGGEEFIILYPESDLPQATAALVRLQRELTKNFFLAEDSKILITFSAGASLWHPGEPMDDVIKRADQAMYEAKQTGKNKVVAR